MGNYIINIITNQWFDSTVPEWRNSQDETHFTGRLSKLSRASGCSCAGCRLGWRPTVEGHRLGNASRNEEGGPYGRPRLDVIGSVWRSLNVYPLDCRQLEGFFSCENPSLTPKHAGWSRRSRGWWFGTFFICPCIGKNNPNWRTHIFQRGWNHQPDYILYIYIYNIYIYIIIRTLYMQHTTLFLMIADNSVCICPAWCHGRMSAATPQCEHLAGETKHVLLLHFLVG